MKKEIKPEDFAHCPLPIKEHHTVQLSHGAGGKMTDDLIDKLFLWAFDNEILKRREDQAEISIEGGRIAVSTDSFVVDPIFFPGGDIGELAVNGTVNDICMGGARPLYLTVGFIIEEGLPLDDLKRIVLSMREAALAVGVKIVAGDTKVVNKGKGDKLFINCTGVGLVEHPYQYGTDRIESGDLVILSGTIADHGIAILSKREGLSFETPIESDTCPLHEMVATIVAAGGAGLHAMRDPTRGGLAATLNEFAARSKTGIRIKEDRIPVSQPVVGACELLGLDPLYVANEGKLVAVVSPDVAEEVLDAIRQHPYGQQAVVIGDVVSDSPGSVTMQTRIGGWRIVDMPVGEQLPRIC